MAQVKICGLTEQTSLDTALKFGADWIGFVHFEKSPRHLSIEDATVLATHARRSGSHAKLVALLVNPDDEMIDTVLEKWAPDCLQLHGAEPGSRIDEIRDKHPHIEIWKALPINCNDDLSTRSEYPNANRFLFDAKPPKSADRPGGWGHTFDWTLLSGAGMSTPWLLAGGLTPENVADAIRVSGATAVDVSSGVESTSGVKDEAKIKAFIEAAKAV